MRKGHSWGITHRAVLFCFFFFQAEDGIRDYKVTGVQTCALPIWFRYALTVSGGPVFAQRPKPPAPATSSSAPARTPALRGPSPGPLWAAFPLDRKSVV